jgi:hypothetical protein
LAPPGETRASNPGKVRAANAGAERRERVMSDRIKLELFSDYV